MLEEEGIDVKFMAINENKPDTAGEVLISKLVD